MLTPFNKKKNAFTVFPSELLFSQAVIQLDFNNQRLQALLLLCDCMSYHMDVNQKVDKVRQHQGELF